METKPTVFVSCGQYTEEELGLGRGVCALIEELTPFQPYFADQQRDVMGLTHNIFHSLHRCQGFVAIMHHRGVVETPSKRTIVRGSVWVEQEIAIISFLGQIESRKLHVAAYVQKGLHREGVRDIIQLNPVEFEDSSEVLEHLRDTLPKWEPSTRESSKVERVQIGIIRPRLSPKLDAPGATVCLETGVDVVLLNEGDTIAVLQQGGLHLEAEVAALEAVPKTWQAMRWRVPETFIANSVIREQGLFPEPIILCPGEAKAAWIEFRSTGGVRDKYESCREHLAERCPYRFGVSLLSLSGRVHESAAVSVLEPKGQ